MLNSSIVISPLVLFSGKVNKAVRRTYHIFFANSRASSLRTPLRFYRKFVIQIHNHGSPQKQNGCTEYHLKKNLLSFFFHFIRIFQRVLENDCFLRAKIAMPPELFQVIALMEIRLTYLWSPIFHFRNW